MRWTNLLASAATWAVAAAVPVVESDASMAFIAGSRPCSILDFWKFALSLSKDAEVYFPGMTGFNQFSQRWSALESPSVNITVLPATENDVVEIVRIANHCNIPFLAYNGLHGSVTTLGRMDWGIAVNLKKLSGVSIAGDGQTATVAGGTNSKLLIDTLWEAEKQAVTGTCECVSYMGPALGGGHGWLQGRHGLIADQFVSLRVVLADGTLKTVDANSDLWWAMRGAGHNFGIVTSVTIKIFPIEHTNWAIETLMFTGDKVKALYQAANDYILKNGDQPVDIINWSYWFNLPQVDPNGPVIEFYIIQEGVDVVDPAYTEPFHALGPISITPKNGTYRDVSGWTGIAMDSPPCQNAGMANPRFPIYLPTYNPDAQEELYKAFASATAGSSPFAGSLFMFEGYSTQGVDAVDAESSAYAYREDNLLIAPLMQYTPAGPERDAEAKKLGNVMRNILHEGSGRAEMHTYVNYAYGDEGVKAWYGYEDWRQDRLQALKTKYDPKGRFSFYAPAA